VTLSRILAATGLALSVLLPTLVWAQFGHPLKGQWSGQWGPPEAPIRLLLDLEWDGKEIRGVINPGPNAATVTLVTFDYSNPAAWKVRIEARGSENGKPGSIVVDGTLENIGAYNRLFHGMWTEGGRKGEFTLTRN
jgi:hypothetical protein